MSDYMVQLWTDFATHYDPTPKTKEWKVFKGGADNFARLDDSKLIYDIDEIAVQRLKVFKDILQLK